MTVLTNVWLEDVTFAEFRGCIIHMLDDHVRTGLSYRRRNYGDQLIYHIRTQRVCVYNPGLVIEKLDDNRECHHAVMRFEHVIVAKKK